MTFFGSEMINCEECNKSYEVGIKDFCDHNIKWVCRQCCKCKFCAKVEK
jgi:hypothetical protein